MPQNTQYRCSMQLSLWHWQQLTVISHCKCRIDLSHRSRTPSTCCMLHRLIPQKWCMENWTAFMTGTITRLPRLGAKGLFTKMVTHVTHGCPKLWMHFILARQRITTDVTFITSLKQGLTVYLDQLNYFRNITSCHIWHHTSNFTHWQRMNWPSTPLRPMALPRRGVYSNALSLKINTLLSPPPISEEQRVNKVCQHKAHEAERRVIDKPPIITLSCITNAPPPIMLTRNPMAKQALKTTPQLRQKITHNNMPGILPRALKTTPRLYQQITCNNMPGILPAPCVIALIPAIATRAPQCSSQGAAPTRVQPYLGPRSTCTAIPSRAHQCFVTQQAINVLTLHEQASFSTIHTPHVLMKGARLPLNCQHYANPMVHLVTAQTISSYKKLMHDPATAKVWQTAFG